MIENSQRSVRRRHAGLVVVAAVVVVALGAGGVFAYLRVSGDDSELPLSPSYYGSSAVVCSLLNEVDLEVNLGYRHDRGFDPGLTLPFTDVPGRTKCGYPLKDAPEGQTTEIAVVYAYANQIFNEVAAARRKLGFGSEVVADLGGRAHWYQGPGELLVLGKDKIVGVFLLTQRFETIAERRERAVRLARTILERLRST